eukprot:scaffold24138_cov35-Tisochrysis_lutea.AAC.1
MSPPPSSSDWANDVDEHVDDEPSTSALYYSAITHPWPMTHGKTGLRSFDGTGLSMVHVALVARLIWRLHRLAIHVRD